MGEQSKHSPSVKENDAGGEAGASAGDPMGRAAVQLIADALLSSAACNVDSIEANHWELSPTAHELVIGDTGSGPGAGSPSARSPRSTLASSWTSSL